MPLGFADFNISDIIIIPNFVKYVFFLGLILIGTISLNLFGLDFTIGEFLFTPIVWVVGGFSGLLGYPIYISYELFSIVVSLILIVLMINSFQQTLKWCFMPQGSIYDNNAQRVYRKIEPSVNVVLNTGQAQHHNPIRNLFDVFGQLVFIGVLLLVIILAFNTFIFFFGGSIFFPVLHLDTLFLGAVLLIGSAVALGVFAVGSNEVDEYLSYFHSLIEKGNF